MTWNTSLGTQFEICLPVMPARRGNGSDARRAVSGFLASCDLFIDRASLSRISVIVPTDYVDAFRPLCAASSLPVEIIAENRLVNTARLPAFPRRGWYIQQLIKLAYGQICDTDFYLTADSDVICVSPLDATIIVDGKAPYHAEIVADHPDWWDGSSKALKISPPGPEQVVCGVTPAFLSRHVAQEAIARLESLARAANFFPPKHWLRGFLRPAQTWQQYLWTHCSFGGRGWTEYSVYWLMALETGLVDQLHYRRSIYTWYDWLDPAHVMSMRASPFAVLQSTCLDEHSGERVLKYLAERDAAIGFRPKADLAKWNYLADDIEKRCG